MSQVSEGERILARARRDFDYYAPRALKIRTKTGQTRPLVLNSAQRVIHERIEEQKRTLKRVRALILKGRQQGASTYVEGRFYWKTSGEHGKRAFILTHEQAATEKIFAMAKRYHDQCPDEFRPHARYDNAKELLFDKFDSGYEVATAGTKAVGRGGTVQYFHGSEVAFWPNAAEHMMGIGQAVPEVDGTEIILESTANGIGNLFHEKWQAAERGEGDYIAIFIPWFIQTEYRRKLPDRFTLDEEEAEYMDAHKLDLEQMAWRRYKIINDFNGDSTRFQQEYPATAAEAFVVVGADSYMNGLHIAAARKVDPASLDVFGPLIIGVDPARSGTNQVQKMGDNEVKRGKGDATGVIRRRGRKAYKLQRFKIGNLMVLTGVLANIIEEEKPTKMFIDVGGLGSGVYDRLVELGYGKIVVQVNYGSRDVMDPVKYYNKRAEMYGLCREWFAEGPVSIEDSNVLHSDLIGPQFGWHSDGSLKIEKKEDMKKRGLKSPDAGDALVSTFAYPVKSDDREVANWKQRLRMRRGSGRSAQAA